MNRVLIHLDLLVSEGYFEDIGQDDILNHIHYLLENDFPKQASPATFIRIPHRNDDGEIG